MIYVSMVEIFQEARLNLVNELGNVKGSWITVIAFFTGIFIIGIIDKLIPSSENPHELHSIEEINEENPERGHHIRQIEKREKALKIKASALRLFTALVITIHNFPEGFTTFVAAGQPQLQ